MTLRNLRLSVVLLLALCPLLGAEITVEQTTSSVGMTGIDFSDYRANTYEWGSDPLDLTADHGLTMSCVYTSLDNGLLWCNRDPGAYGGNVGPSLILCRTDLNMYPAPLTFSFWSKDGSGRRATVSSFLVHWFYNRGYNVSLYGVDDQQIGSTIAITTAPYGVSPLGWRTLEDGAPVSAIHRIEVTYDAAAGATSYGGIFGSSTSVHDLLYDGYEQADLAAKTMNVVSHEEFIPAPDLTAIRAQRDAAAGRTRQIIMDNDGGDATHSCPEPTPEALLAERTTCLFGTQIDTISYCDSVSFGMVTHNSTVADVLTTKETPFENNVTADLIAQGTDPLEVITDYCRSHGMEIFWNMRMNDTHDGWISYRDLIMAQFKTDHPEYLVGALDNKPPHGQWSAVDYARPEVRQHAYDMVEEVCQNYDIDGIEFDFFRHPILFKKQAWGADCGPEERDMLAELMQALRRMADREGIRRGRPFVLMARLPDSVEYCNAMGVDLVRWLAEDVIDGVIASGYYRLKPWQTTVDLCHEYGKKCYPCLSESREPDAVAKAARMTTEALRGRSMNVWGVGGDGVFIFNQIGCYRASWNQIGSPTSMRYLPKTYVTAARHLAYVDMYIANGERFIDRQVVMPSRPLRLTRGNPADIILPVHESTADLNYATVFLQLRLSQGISASDLTARINGVTLATGVFSDPYVEYAVPETALIQGDNVVTVTLGASAGSDLDLLDVLLQVTYPY